MPSLGDPAADLALAYVGLQLAGIPPSNPPTVGTTRLFAWPVGPHRSDPLARVCEDQGARPPALTGAASEAGRPRDPASSGEPVPVEELTAEERERQIALSVPANRAALRDRLRAEGALARLSLPGGSPRAGPLTREPHSSR